MRTKVTQNGQREHRQHRATPEPAAPEKPAEQGAMRAAWLLDRCYMGWDFFGRLAGSALSNQWVASNTLLDGCLTGSGNSKAGYGAIVKCEIFHYQLTCPLQEINAELAGVEQRTVELLRKVTE